MKVLTQAGYLPQAAILVRVEVLDSGGRHDRELWDAEATFSTTTPGITLSTNKAYLRNGLGSALVTVSGGGDFTLTTTVGGLSTNGLVRTLTNAPVTRVGGTLSGSSTTWSGVVRLTNTVTVPVGHTLTIQSNTLVLINGVASGTGGYGLIINGTLQSLGTATDPVTITCSDATLRWGQIRHSNAQPSLYRWTTITRGGRAPGEGHTGQAPVIRPSGSTVIFEDCNITDHADASGTPGKIAQGIGSDLTFRNCLFARARMGPEIQGTALLCTNTWIMEMRGLDDADGIYVHAQSGGQTCVLKDCVIADGEDDGVDTLDSVLTIEGCIIRDWDSQIEDAKGVSVFNGATHLRRCLVVSSTVGVAAKWSSGAATLVTINQSTIAGNLTNLLAQYKVNAPGPFIDYRITNSILWGGDAVQSDFGATNFTIAYSDISEAWAGAGNFNADPLFMNPAARDYRLRSASPCIDAGAPASPVDPDGTPADLGAFPFQAATNVFIALGNSWKYLDDGSNQGTNWITVAFNDSSWSNGLAQLGFGDGDEVTIIRSNRQITTYFRRPFVLSDAPNHTNLSLRLLRDDGGVVYLNGVEIYRSPNMPAGTIAFDMTAANTPDNTVDNVTVDGALDLLVNGTNLLAVEIHQQSATSSDVSFDFELVGVTGRTGGGQNQPPTVAMTNPANNATFTEPADISLTASASDADGSVAKVEFFQNGAKLGEDLSAPYDFAWNGVLQGTYVLTAVATDDQGATTTSPAITVNVSSANQPTTNTLVALGSTWTYLDNGSDQGTNWSQLGFDDSGWAGGVAPLGYPSGKYGIATVVSYGPDLTNKYITTYFRRPFTVTDPRRVLGLNLNLLRDDGAVVYLNGLEVHRVNLPAGSIASTTLALNASDYTIALTSLPTNALDALVAGTNVLAVEVHQGNATSSDLVLEAQLDAIVSAETNARPVVVLTAPANGLTVAAPASLTLTATASDSDGSVTNVTFLANGSKLGDDATEPYSFNWNSIAAGVYALSAAATDNVGWSSTSSVVTVTVSTNIAAPVVYAKTPAPGSVTSLTNITVTFSKPVVGVDAADLLVNGLAAAGVSGSGSNYTFSFPQPAYGAVSINWASGHGIADVFTPPHPFNTNSLGANWQYTLQDAAPPVVAALDPVPGSTLAALGSVAVTFSEPVSGVQASDLLINAAPATSVTGSGAGPYTFAFSQPAAGAVQFTWVAGHGIVDTTGNPFAGGSWSYVLDPTAAGVVISEIMYHPSSENILEEYLELYNKGDAVVNLAGWRFSEGVQFTFPSVVLPPNGYLVVCADLATFTGKYPGVTNVVGNWTGFLNNSGEDIDLDDATGQRVNSVRYADEGDWAIRQRGPNDLSRRGWIWYKEHDGLGKSLEVINPALPNDLGQNWAASVPAQGTPGRANSVLTNNVAPLILDVRHFPVIPKSSEAVQVTARLIDEAVPSVSVTLHHRVDSTTTNNFAAVPMTDDGLNGDAAAGDGLYTATIPARANNAVVEFYVMAADFQGRIRTWPAPAIPAADGAGPSGQIVNALYQVDDVAYNPTNNQPQYKLIMTETERAELAGIPCSGSQNSDAQMNGTFISLDTSGGQLRYLCGFRNRGHGTRCASPPNYHIGFRTDDRWKDVTALALNSQNAHIQHLGSVLARKAGAAGADSIAVRVRVNNTDRTPTYGSYVANEVVNSDWAARHYPFDPNGNIYRAIRDIAPDDFDYRGDAYTAYANTYFKESNVPENYWEDLINMLRTVGINNANPFTTQNVREVANVEQWMTHLAVMSVCGNAETGLNSGYNDDYWMYFGVMDPRAILLYWDLDSILGVSSLGATSGIYTSTANNGAGQALDRFLNQPDFNPIYLRTLKTLLETTFAQSNFNAVVDQTLGGYVPVGALTAIKSWMDQRRNYLLGSVLIDVPPASNAPVATVVGVPRSPTPRTGATLTVGGSDIVAYRYRLNGGAYGAETPVATVIALAGLANGTNTVRVIGKNSTDSWQDTNRATTVAWVVNTAWPAVRLNEVLARNDSAVNHSGTFPDVIELFNEGTATVDLSGLRLTDDPAEPNKFTFPATTTLAAGTYLVVYANNPDGTPGFHLGFNLDGQGEGVYLFDSLAHGGALLDSVMFGLQLADLSIGRVGQSGEWVLCSPTFPGANSAQSLGDPRQLRINEWLASGVNPYPYDFIELYNPDSLPVTLGDLSLTDQPIGAPKLSPIRKLSFIGANGFTTFVADGKPGQGADHVDFKLAIEQGEIGLAAGDGTLIDSVIYGPQQTDVSSGRCPDGSVSVKPLVVPTPGSPNACPVAPPPPAVVTFLTLTNGWRYDSSGSDLGTDWRTTNYNDSAWAQGRGVFGYDNNNNPLVQSLTNTVLPLTTTGGAAIVTFYFRTHFQFPVGLVPTSLVFTNLMDDGAIVYLNEQEIYRLNMPAGTVTAATFAASSTESSSFTEIAVPLTNNIVRPGDNVVAVELHQASGNPSDINMGLALGALIVTNSPALAGVMINEVLANNATLEEPDGRKPDWVEIYNPSSNAVDLADMSLTDDTINARRWVFPAGSIVPALGFFSVRLDPDLPASSTNAGFGLKAEGGAVYLINRPADGGAPANAISYGLQAADWSIGRVPDGTANWVLTIPNFGGPNLVATLGDPAQLKVNEWMANPASGDDWFEIYNPNGQPVDISRCWLSDSLDSRQNTQLPSLSFIGIGAYGFQEFKADGNTAAGPDHVGFGLRASGEALAFSTPAGVLINGLSFGSQQTGVSQGRLPDGTANIVLFPATPTPGKPNFLPLTSVVINEVFTHSDLPFEDAVEIYNPTGDDVDISNWYLSDSQNNLLKYRVPSTTVVRAGGYVVFYEYQFNTDNPDVPFSFSSAKGDEVYLSQASAPGVLTGYRAFAEFGAAENGVSFGRFPTSIAMDFTAMNARTFGADNPGTVEEFRTGTGKANAYPKVGPVVINEIMYRPPGTNDALEFVELHNILGTSVPLYDPANPNNTWRMRKGIDFDFPPGVTLPAGGFLVLVSFDPATDPAALAAFRAAYGSSMVLYGPYSGKLDNAGEAIEFQRPDAPQTVPGPDFGLVPRIVVDRVLYSPFGLWPPSPAGTGDSLKKTTASLYGNEPLNWSGGAPTPGAANGSVTTNNTPPTLAPIGSRTVVEGTTLSFTATAQDTDDPPQTLTFSLDPGAPATASITLGGAFTWTPIEADGPGSYSVTVRVADNGTPLMSDFETITITVLETNAAPVLVAIGSKVVDEGTLVTLTASATDPDLPANTLTYSLDAGAPAGATIHATTGAFAWQTTETNGGSTVTVTVRVTDNGTPPRNDSETLTITVNEVNSPPTLDPIGNRTVNEGDLVTFTATASDADRPVQTLQFSLEAGAPEGASITTNGAFTWRPTEAQGPTNATLRILVTDNGTPPLTAARTFTITVNESNSVPVLGGITNRTVTEGVLITFTATATDTDAPPQLLTFSLGSGAPAGASMTTNGTFTWTPTEAQGPTNATLRVIVTDTGTPTLTATQTFTVTVNESNAAPLLAAIGDKAVTVGSLLAFTAAATDSDLPTNRLTFLLDAGAPTGAALTTNGVFTWTPTAGQSGTHPVTIRVRDNGEPPLEDFEAINIAVSQEALTVQLLVFTNTWRYHALGQDLGTAWRAGNYNDSAWSNGPALLYNETAGLPEPKSTPIPLVNGSTSIITYYFRTHFHLAAEPAGVTLTASNLIDDGAVFYLNGVEAARYNMPTGAVTVATLAPVVVGNATTYVVTNLSPSALQLGDNVLAVEVHQNASNSTDVVFGMSLTGTVPGQTPITITSQPTHVVVTAGSPAQFNVAASGSAPQYQWFKNGAIIPGADGASYSLANAQTNDAGNYTVIVSNYLNRVTSSNAVLTVNPPANTPPVLAAIGAKGVVERTLLAFTATAGDAEAPPQTLTFSLDNGAPTNASITAGGQFAWMPTEAQGPGSYAVTIRVTDNGTPPLNDFETITITVAETNSPPTMAAIGDKVVAVGATLSFIVTATDPDLPANPLTFSLAAGAATNASITVTGLFTWKPGAPPGTNAVRVIVADGGTPSLSQTQTFQVIVAGASRILRITQLDPNTHKLDWESIAGLTYQAEHSQNLAPGSWQPLGSPVTATGPVTSVIDPAAAQPRRFYRVVLLP